MNLFSKQKGRLSCRESEKVFLVTAPVVVKVLSHYSNHYVSFSLVISLEAVWTCFITFHYAPSVLLQRYNCFFRSLRLSGEDRASVLRKTSVGMKQLHYANNHDVLLQHSDKCMLCIMLGLVSMPLVFACVWDCPWHRHP